jgi:hypothetical protein
MEDTKRSDTPCVSCRRNFRRCWSDGKDRIRRKRSSLLASLQSKNQAIAFAAATAYHHRFIRGLFLGAQHRIPVVRLAGEDLRFA